MKNILLLITLFFITVSLSAGTFTPLQTAPATGIVGDVRVSFLTEAQFQARAGGGWILADGRDVTGSKYHTVTGNTLAPDARGRALRMKDNGAGVNPDGELALGAVQADQFLGHQHTYGISNGNGGGNSGYGLGRQGRNSNAITDGTGGNETRMKNVTVNYFVRVN